MNRIEIIPFIITRWDALSIIIIKIVELMYKNNFNLNFCIDMLLQYRLISFGFKANEKNHLIGNKINGFRSFTNTVCSS